MILGEFISQLDRDWFACVEDRNLRYLTESGRVPQGFLPEQFWQFVAMAWQQSDPYDRKAFDWFQENRSAFQFKIPYPNRPSEIIMLHLDRHKVFTHKLFLVNIKILQNDYLGQQRSEESLPLTKWAFLSFEKDLARIAEIAKAEAWQSNYEPHLHLNQEFSFNRLKNYLQQTFRRLQEEDKIIAATYEGKPYRAFNTGLISYDDKEIFLIFDPNYPNQEQPWKLYGVCTPGNGIGNEILHQAFQDFTPRAQFISDYNQATLILDPNKPIDQQLPTISDDHFLDHLERWPPEVIERELRNDPQAFSLFDHLQSLDNTTGQIDRCWLEFKQYIMRTIDLKLRFKKSIESALRNSWEYIIQKPWLIAPQYNFGRHEVELLLPLRLHARLYVDLALVITASEGSYQYKGRTVLTREMAYNNARLLYPLSPDHWLRGTSQLNLT
ncbi:DUF3825 domain-containing protein [Entomospira culicis]|uniref:DUF3825 domain-containing protein n=1 Tax=Entomospira culicis TaxID=2719989 RepID=A0A968L0B3_9SPIO|nr:DUF3825 domain-containing protein [Entomospira culicis]NIZ19959.1 DUF3825 domain-containing protein [Entomospira culicis]NIZ70176.1 DUF3825 domain-containing protein [Entomospira culicis]WDI38009.1 DUF3825 domain-containing protein [Entomospira culicis]WDI39632.1 DUF3825 domain-containing protein [Entomospira culicis]